MTHGEFDDLHDELRAVARGMLGKAGAGSTVDWPQIARSGWLGLEAPTEFGGAGATFAEVAALLEEMGRAVACGPFSSVAVLGLGALGLIAPNLGRDRLFREAIAGESVPIAVMSGDCRDSFAIGERCGPSPSGVIIGAAGVGVDATVAKSARAGSAVPAFRLVAGPDALYLYGSAEFVPDAPYADLMLVPARAPDGAIVTAVVTPGAPGMEITAQPVVDTTRTLATVTADHVAIPPESVWRFSGDPTTALCRLHDRAALATACDSLGLSEAMLQTTVEYVGVREQFGRPIGSFQAVKHACADMLVQVTVARQLIMAAVRAQVEQRPDASTAASMAKAYTTAAAVEVAGTAMQLHGGIGYTWESGIHAYLKRATLNRSLFGTPAQHRRRIGRRYA